MRTSIFMISALAFLSACATVNPIRPAVSVRPVILSFEAPGDLYGSGEPLLPPSSVSGQMFQVTAPNDDWVPLKDDDIMPGHNDGLYNRRTGAIITFRSLMLADVCTIAKYNREELLRVPGSKASDIACSPDNTVASYTIEDWGTATPPALQSRLKVLVRSVPGKPHTPVLALGGWVPLFNEEMTGEFDAIVASITYQ